MFWLRNKKKYQIRTLICLKFGGLLSFHNLQEAILIFKMATSIGLLELRLQIQGLMYGSFPVNFTSEQNIIILFLHVSIPILSRDVAYKSGTRTCDIIDKPLVGYMFSNIII